MGKVVNAVSKVIGTVASVLAVIPGPHQPIAAAVAVGAGLASSLTQPEVPQSATQLGRLQARLDTHAARKIVLGPRTAMPADIRYYEGSGENDEFIDYILVVAAHRVGSIDEIWFEDQQAWAATGGVQGEFAGYLTAVDIRLEGTAANTIAINGGTRWGADCRLTGCAYLRLRIKRTGNSDDEQSPLANGLPGRVTIIGEGMPCYDPRFDSTVGGSGTQLLHDQSTWGPSADDPIIQSLNVLIGWRINGELSVGAGLPAKYLDLDSAITGANICDEDIALSAGGTQKRYRTAGAFSTDDAPMAIVGALLAGCAGELLDSEGRLSFLIKTNTLATPAVTFDDHDILSGGQWDAMGGQTNLPNIVSGNFTDPGDNALFQMVPYPSVKLPSEDGIQRTLPLDLGTVDNAARAERIVKQTLQRKQYPGTFAAEFNMKGMAAKVGRVVWLTRSVRGWVDKPFRVVSQTPSRSGRIALVLREEHLSIYAWAAEDSASVQAAEPVGFDPRNSGPILLARQAGKTAEWPSVKDPVGTKPEDNATVGAALSDEEGEGGNLTDSDGNVLAPGSVLNDYLDLSPDGVFGFRRLPGQPIEEIGRIDVEGIGAAKAIDLDLAMAKIESSATAIAAAQVARDRLAEATLRLATTASKTREQMRDAGITVDPETGQVRIHAIERNAERLSETEIRLDAAESSILLRATTNYVDEQLALAVLDPSQIADLESVFLRLGSAETRLDGAEASITSKAEIVELNAATARITTAEQDIEALEGAITTKVETATFAALDTRVTSAEQTLSALGDVSQFTQIVSATRLVEQKADSAAQTALEALLDADKERRDRVALVAEVRREVTARIVDNETAEALERSQLAVRIDKADAAIVTEAAARVSGDEALSQTIATVQAQASGNAAAIEAETTARVDGDEALGQQITTVQGEVDANAAAIQSEETARANADGSLATASRTLQARGDATAESALEGVLEADKVRRNSRDALAVARQEFTARTVGNAEAEAAARQLLAARIGNNEAALLLEQITRAAEDAALAQLVATLQAEVDGNAAAIQTETTVRADAVGALAESISTVQASASANEDAIGAEAHARADAVDAANARIDQEETARAEADQAIAQSVQTVSTKVDANEASVTTIAQSVDGLKARAGVRLDVNGRVVGWVAEVDEVDETGDFLIYADRFAIISPDGSETIVPFEVVDGFVFVNGAKVTPQSIAADRMGAGSIGQGSASYTRSTMTISSTSAWADVVSLTLTSKYGKPVKGLFAASARQTEGGQTDTEWRVQRDDGVVVWGPAPLNVTEQGQTFTPFFFDGSTKDRQTTYALQAKKSNNGQVVSIGDRTGFLEELNSVNFQSFSTTGGGSGGGGTAPGGGGIIP